MPRPPRDEREGPSAEDVDLEAVVDEQGGQDGADDAPADPAPGDAADDDTPFTTPTAGDSLSPEELRRES